MSTDTGETDLDSDGSEEPRIFLPGDHSGKNLTDIDADDDNRPLLFDFTQNLDKRNSTGNAQYDSNIDENVNSKPITEMPFDGHTDEEDEEEDGYLKPFFEEMIPITSGHETMEYYHQKIQRLNKKIDVKEKAYSAGIAVSNQMPLSKKERSKV